MTDFHLRDEALSTMGILADMLEDAGDERCEELRACIHPNIKPSDGVSWYLSLHSHEYISRSHEIGDFDDLPYWISGSAKHGDWVTCKEPFQWLIDRCLSLIDKIPVPV